MRYSQSATPAFKYSYFDSNKLAGLVHAVMKFERPEAYGSFDVSYFCTGTVLPKNKEIIIARPTSPEASMDIC